MIINSNIIKMIFNRNNYIKNSRQVTNLSDIGIKNINTIYHNLSNSDIYNHEVKNNEGIIAKTKYGDVFSIDTGKFTGRSPNDKWIVKNINSESDKNIWWGDVNRPISEDIFDDLYNVSIDHFNTLDKCYVFDGYCGSNPKSRKKVRFVHELAWQHHFVSNMFINIKYEDELQNFEPDFTIINACSKVNEKWKQHNLNSDVAIAFNIEKKLAVILGTWYGGENKKGIFSLMNYWLPLQNIMTMHCSANIGNNGDTALFFGLSGTGKTTLSADPQRSLIGDDEHGWDDDGIFNLEGGCYAKTINLEEKNEPEIYKAIKTDALLENVYHNEDNTPDYFNTSKTENGRVSYPIHHINNWYQPQVGGHPKNIIFLTCDAFGILPPIAKLTTEQAMYHFLNGYTAKIAGTERGIKEPQATFSACFGEAFLTLHPTYYAELLKKKIDQHDSKVYLINTGWMGGPYGIGERISIKNTRQCVNSVLDNKIDEYETIIDPLFNFEVPIISDDIPYDMRNTWDNKNAYDEKANELLEMFDNNYKKYTNYSKL